MTSKATKRKHVIKEVLDEFILPGDGREIVKVVSSCGNNLHQVVNPKGEQFLVSMPSKFRRNVWIKRDDYVMVEPIEEGDRVKAEIFTILYKEQIKHIKENNLWPEEFASEKDSNTGSTQIDDDLLPPTYSDSEDSEAGGDNLLRGAGNPNRPNVRDHQEEDSESESD